MTRRAFAALAAAVLFTTAASACGEDDDARRPDDPPASTATTTTAWRSCEARSAGYALEYPPDWHTNSGEVDEPCHWFHPEQFELEPATDTPGIAVHVRTIDTDLATPVRRVTSSPGSEVLRREDREVAGRSAALVETRSTGDALLPAGAKTYAYYVAAGPRVLAGSASDTARPQGTTFEDVKGVLDGMVRSLRFLAPSPEPRCSAAGLSGMPERQRDLPVPVAATRRAIVDAATDCDYQRLAALASGGQRSFTATFGGADDVGAYWQRAEAEGGEPLRYLVGLLDRPFARRDVESATRFLWPSAFAYDRWRDVPTEEREILRPLYDDEDFHGFEQFGGYIGFRIGIAADGEWLFFVAGD